MTYNQKFYFFRCNYCGEWFYSSRLIKTKKCWKCNHSFQIKKSVKFSKKCNTEVAIAIIKELKLKMGEENLIKYLKQNK